MNIPDSIKIGYKDYKIEKVAHLDDEERLLYGQILYDKEVISLCDRYTENQMKCTLIHEIIHGVDDFLGIELQEEQVKKLAKGLYQVIEDNPAIFERI